ncbi:MAG: 50S ribosomal protein L18 [Pirellulales bacterium]
MDRQRERRRHRVRKRLKGTPERPRLTVSRSHKHIYCQLIDDTAGKTLCSASTRDKDLRAGVSYGGNCDAAVVVGQALARRAQALGIQQLCFDRGEYKFHGRIAALANAAREAGMQF